MLTVRLGSMDAVVVRVFASHHCGPGSVPGPDVTWGGPPGLLLPHQ